MSSLGYNYTKESETIQEIINERDAIINYLTRLVAEKEEIINWTLLSLCVIVSVVATYAILVAIKRLNSKKKKSKNPNNPAVMGSLLVYAEKSYGELLGLLDARIKQAEANKAWIEQYIDTLKHYRETIEFAMKGEAIVSTTFDNMRAELKKLLDVGSNG